MKTESSVELPDTPLDELPLDHERGSMGMLLAITTEALLFVSMFFAYFYIGHARFTNWPSHPPKRELALIMLAVLLTSSVVLHLGEKAVKKSRIGEARLWVAATVLLGIAFLVVQTLEYSKHLAEELPTANAYTSLFFTITSIHGLHVVVGLAFLVYVLFLPEIGEHSMLPPHRALHNASLYWHFVDAVWLCIVLLLYLLPHWTRS
jgi:heme/copper-type cytochrome/quinol oxidase subunit 3